MNQYWVVYEQSHELTREISQCRRNGSHIWNYTSGTYNDYTDTDPEIVRPEDID